MKHTSTSWRPGVSRGRIETLRQIIRSLTLVAGRPPSDAELARLLATTETHIRRARARIRGDR